MALLTPLRRLFTADEVPESITASAQAVTAAASKVSRPSSSFLQHTQEWQSEAWGFYDSLAEFNSGIWWLSNMLSRVRLKAAELSPDTDEPSIITEKTLATEIMDRLSGGVGGQAQLMRNITIQLSAPGDCYLIGEGTATAENWTVRSIDEVRVQNNKFQVVSDRVPNVVWSDLPEEGMPVRIWRPHPRFYHLADSNARAALPVARELELVNRHIIAQYLSRLASAGVLVIPEEATFPVREEFADEPDPLMSEFIEISAEAIRTPGTAAGVVPIFIKVPKEVADVIRHIDFTLKIDEKIIEKRDSAVRRLASKLDVPTEVITGMGDVNHWTAWQLDEGALKTHIAPMAEIIVDSLTRGYLRPRMKAAGATDEEIAKAVVWYDMSELAMRPDKSTGAKDAYDRMEISGAALRRETGFDEDDAPTAEELVSMGLKVILKSNPNLQTDALRKLSGDKVFTDAASPAASGGPAPAAPPEQEPPEEEPVEPGPPGEGKTPTGPKEAAAAVLRHAQLMQQRADSAEADRQARTARQAAAGHLIKFNKTKRSLIMMHPRGVCDQHAWSCPYTHAVWDKPPRTLSTGVYRCVMTADGSLSVGAPAPELDNGQWISVDRTIPETLKARRPANGRAR